MFYTRMIYVVNWQIGHLIKNHQKQIVGIPNVDIRGLPCNNIQKKQGKDLICNRKVSENFIICGMLLYPDDLCSEFANWAFDKESL